MNQFVNLFEDIHLMRLALESIAQSEAEDALALKSIAESIKKLVDTIVGTASPITSVTINPQPPTTH